MEGSKHVLPLGASGKSGSGYLGSSMLVSVLVLPVDT